MAMIGVADLGVGFVVVREDLDGALELLDAAGVVRLLIQEDHALVHGIAGLLRNGEVAHGDGGRPAWRASFTWFEIDGHAEDGTGNFEMLLHFLVAGEIEADVVSSIAQVIESEIALSREGGGHRASVDGVEVDANAVQAQAGLPVGNRSADAEVVAVTAGA